MIVVLEGVIAAQVTTGTISGTVTDQSGQVVAGARITATHLATGVARTVTTDGAGRYQIPALALGTYELQGEEAGFQTSIRSGIELTVGRSAVVDLTLQVGAVTEKVVVTAEAPLVETSSSTMAGLVNQKEMRELPLNTRSYLQLATLETGVQQFRNAGEPVSTAPLTGRGVRISMSGARPEFNNYLLDGVDSGDAINNAPGGAAGVFLGVETLREFQVLTHNYSAEYGRVAGGIINAVSRAGDNQFHGTAFEFLRNNKLDARNFFDPRQKPGFKRNQFGAVFSGPIKQDRVFFLTSYEGLRERLGRTIVSVVPDQNARNGIISGAAPITVSPNARPFFALYPLPNGRNFGNGTAEFTFNPTQPTREDFATARIDYKLSDQDSLFARYTIDDSDVLRPITFPLFAVSDISRNQNATIQEQRIFSPRLLNTVRFGFVRSPIKSLDTERTPIDPALSFVAGKRFGTLLVGGLSPLGITNFGPVNETTQNLFDVSDHLVYTSGAHMLKAGVNIKRFQVNTTADLIGNGLWNFFSLPNFLQAQPFAFLSESPAAGFTRAYRQLLFGFYAQDDYKIRPGLTLNLGLRYEFVTVPTEVNGKFANFRNPLTDTKAFIGDDIVDNPSLRNFAPRAGFAWDPFGTGKTAVRGGIGIYYNQVGYSFFFRPLLFTPPFGDVTALPGSLPIVTFPRQRVFPANIVFPTQFDLDTPNVLQYSFTLEREVFRDLMVTVGYVGSRGIHLGRPTEINTFPFQVVNGQKVFPVPGPPPSPSPQRINPNFAAINLIDTGGNSYYNSLQLGVNKRFSQGLQFQVSYTWSRSIDDSPALLRDVESGPSIVLDAYDRKVDRGLSSFDIRHNLTFNYTYDLPIGAGLSGAMGKLLAGWEVTGITTITSGTPFTLENAFDRASTGKIGPFLTDRPNLRAGADNNPRRGGPDRYFDPSAFELQRAGVFGNLGRNTLIGPGLANVDFSLVKNTTLREKLHLQFRSEFFNIFNRANFSVPTGAGRIAFLGAAPAPGAPGIPNPSAGRIFKTVTSSRQIQFGLKLVF